MIQLAPTAWIFAVVHVGGVLMISVDKIQMTCFWEFVSLPSILLAGAYWGCPGNDAMTIPFIGFTNVIPESYSVVNFMHMFPILFNFYTSLCQYFFVRLDLQQDVILYRVRFVTISLYASVALILFWMCFRAVWFWTCVSGSHVQCNPSPTPREPPIWRNQR
jgi:hypothetical protein